MNCPNCQRDTQGADTCPTCATLISAKDLAVRLRQARSDLTDAYKRRFGKGTLDLPCRRMVGDKGLVLQWEHRPYMIGGQICLIDTWERIMCRVSANNGGAETYFDAGDLIRAASDAEIRELVGTKYVGFGGDPALRIARRSADPKVAQVLAYAAVVPCGVSARVEPLDVASYLWRFRPEFAKELDLPNWNRS